MRYFDCHCDTLKKMYHNKKRFFKNSLDCDLSLINPGDTASVVYAVFNNGSYKREDMINIFSYFNEMKADVTCHRAYLSVEALGNQRDFLLEDIALYKKFGVRMASLCWNEDNILCGGIKENKKGLTLLGKKTVLELLRNSIIPDVSHASDRALKEIVELCETPVCASHSCSRKVWGNPRNLSDEDFKLIASKGGVVGINFYPDFVGKCCDIDSVICHIEHFLNLGGEDNIGLGSDFDGIDRKVKGLENCRGVYNLKDKMIKKGYGEELTDKIFYKNFNRVFKIYE